LTDLLSDDAGDENGDGEYGEDAGGGGGAGALTTAAVEDVQGGVEALMECLASEGAKGVEAGDVGGKFDGCSIPRNPCVLLLLLVLLVLLMLLIV
jgi:hypothetical protein